MFEKKELKFDVEQIQEMANKTESIANELTDLSQTLQSSVENLRTKWNTPAGKEFFNEVEFEWQPVITKYVSILGGVNEILKEAARIYSQLEDDANALKF